MSDPFHRYFGRDKFIPNFPIEDQRPKVNNYAVFGSRQRYDGTASYAANADTVSGSATATYKGVTGGSPNDETFSMWLYNTQPLVRGEWRNTSGYSQTYLDIDVGGSVWCDVIIYDHPYWFNASSCSLVENSGETKPIPVGTFASFETELRTYAKNSAKASTIKTDPTFGSLSISVSYTYNTKKIIEYKLLNQAEASQILGYGYWFQESSVNESYFESLASPTLESAIDGGTDVQYFGLFKIERPLITAASATVQNTAPVTPPPYGSISSYNSPTVNDPQAAFVHFGDSNPIISKIGTGVGAGSTIEGLDQAGGSVLATGTVVATIGNFASVSVTSGDFYNTSITYFRQSPSGDSVSLIRIPSKSITVRGNEQS